MKTAKKFINFSDEKFVGVWNKEQFPFEAGESQMLQSFLANHFAKHLVDRELIKAKLNTTSPDERAEMMAKCLGKVEIKAKTNVSLEAAIINDDKAVEANSEAIHVEKEHVEKEFEDLKEINETTNTETSSDNGKKTGNKDRPKKSEDK